MVPEVYNPSLWGRHGSRSRKLGSHTFIHMQEGEWDGGNKGRKSEGEGERRRGTEEEVGCGYKPSKSAISGILPQQGTTHLLKVPYHPGTASQTDDQVFKSTNLYRTFPMKTTRAKKENFELKLQELNSTSVLRQVWGNPIQHKT